MTITNGYATLNDFKVAHFPDQTLDTSQDAAIELAIEAASRAIDRATGRRFYAATETNYYTANVARYVMVDDLLTLTELATDDGGALTWPTAWSAGDYVLHPFNAPHSSSPEPYARIIASPNSGRLFPLTDKGVRVTGSFGYASVVPKLIKEATLMLALRLFKRRDAPFGIMGSSETGEVETIPSVKADSDIALLIGSYRRRALI